MYREKVEPAATAAEVVATSRTGPTATNISIGDDQLLPWFPNQSNS